MRGFHEATYAANAEKKKEANEQLAEWVKQVGGHLENNQRRYVYILGKAEIQGNGHRRL